MLEISAGGVVYRRGSGSELQIQLIRDRFGKVTLAKGKLEAGETVEQAALREIGEETGVRGRLVSPLTVTEYTYEHEVFGAVQKRVHFFLVEYNEGELQAQVEEIDGVFWAAPREAWSLQLAQGYANNDRVLLYALRSLGWDPLASAIDHTVLKADVQEADIVQLCDEAVRHRFASVCVHSGWVPFCRERLAGSDVKIAAVCGFPFGADATELKAQEAAWAVANGADEIDMVLHVGQLLAGNVAEVTADIRAVVEAAAPALVKVIFETGYLSNEQKRIACRSSVEAGAGYVKTSTGFGPGGATVADIELMRAEVGAGVGVKASGGVRDEQAALAMLRAGATRIGTSSGVKIVAGGERPMGAAAFAAADEGTY